MSYPSSLRDVHPSVSKFMRGGCLVYAHAALDVLAEQGIEGDLVGVDFNGQVHHVLVHVEGEGFFDALGFHDEDQVIDFWSAQRGGPVILRSVDDDDLLGYIIDDDWYDEAFEEALYQLG